MQLKKIAVAALALAAGSSFAAITMNASGVAGNTGTGLVFIVTDTLNNKSFDFDTATSFTSVSDSTYKTFNVAADTNWGSFYDAARTGDFVWSLVGGLSDGAATSVGKNALLTTVTNGFSVSSITAANASNISTITGNLNNVIADFNQKATGASFVASLANNDIAYVGATGPKLDYTLNNQVAPDFTTGNAIGATSQFLKLANVGGRGAANVYTNPATYSATFADGTLTIGTAPVTPSIPEPESYGLALVGLLMVGAVARRRAA
jgi:hypothetical protein